MSLQVEKLEKNMAKLTIEVPADDLEKALQSAYMKQRTRSLCLVSVKEKYLVR